jgi:hypothetical protein
MVIFAKPWKDSLKFGIQQGTNIIQVDMVDGNPTVMESISKARFIYD